MSTIRLHEVSKKFGPHVALDKISLQIQTGDFVAIVGRSGSGKSTLLRLIAGLTDVAAGEIFLEEQNATRWQPSQRNMGIMFQYDSLYPHMTVRENLNFAKPKHAGSMWDTQLQDLIGWMEIDSLLQRMPAELSGGELQRVALARALIRSPRVLLLDEPLSHLDNRLKARVLQKIIEAHRKFSMTMLYVTHDIDEALAVANRIVVLDEGRLVQFATTAEIYSQPEPFVREFFELDRICIRDAVPRKHLGQTTIHLNDVEIPLDAQSRMFVGTESAKTELAKETLEVVCRVRLVDWKRKKGVGSPPAPTP
jgi:ABC-type sugar transport system ATPase subunit